jgi:acyl transferase domain-containing protein
MVAARGRLIQQLPGGLMLAVNLSEQEITPLLNDKLSLAATNGASQCVVSGPLNEVARLECQLDEQGLATRRLSASHAFHSQMMEPVLNQFETLLGKVKMRSPQIPYLSNVTGDWINASEATSPRYWAQHLRRTVRFVEGLQLLIKPTGSVLLEVGPGNTLGRLAKTLLGETEEHIVLSSMPHSPGRKDGRALMLKTLGHLWASGAPVDWTGFYKHERRHRMSLPPYPFERQRYWIEPAQQTGRADTHKAIQERKSDIDGWSYVPVWRQSAPATLFETELLSKQNLSWLVFSDKHVLGPRLIERLRNMGLDVITVLAGEQFARLDTDTYLINPRHARDYTRLFKELRELGKAPQIVAHLWSITSGNQAQAEPYSFETSQDNGFYSLLFLAQAIGEYAGTARLKIGVVSNSLHAVAGEEMLFPERATLLGPLKVIPQEYPFVTCQNIDVELPAAGQEVSERFARQLISELMSDSSNCVVAYRQERRWEQGFEAIQLDNAVNKTSRLREEGVYLITGGLGAIGLIMAGHLASQLRAKLVLVGRSAFPEREEWAEFLNTHDERHDTSRKIRQLLAFEEMGATVMLASADVSNREQMNVVINRALERFGTINGVIHAAGIAGGGLIQLKAPEVAANILAPKVEGLMALDALLQNIELDFLVLCSSLSSILGGFGQVDYCGANAFLDAFALKAASIHNRPVISINWDTWQGAGMAFETTLPPDLERWRAENRQRAILPEEGIEILTRVLCADIPQVAISTQDLCVAAQGCKSTSTAISHEDFIRANLSRPQHARPALVNAYAPPENPVEQLIVNVWKELLGFEEVGIHDNFFDLGGHSLLATQVISRLRKVFREHVPMRLIFDAPTVAELAATLKQLSLSADEEVEAAPLLELINQLPEDEIEALFAEI